LQTRGHARDAGRPRPRRQSRFVDWHVLASQIRNVAVRGGRRPGTASLRCEAHNASGSLEEAKERRHLGSPCKQAHDDAAAGGKNLSWHSHDGIEEGTEVHAQPVVALFLVLLSPAGLDWQQQGRPRLKCPRQCAHYHIGAICIERVDRGVERVNASLQLRDQVLLVAALVRFSDDGLGSKLCVVRDIEEVANLVEQGGGSLLDSEVLAHDDNSVVTLTGEGSVFKLSNILGAQADVPVFIIANDLLLDCCRARWMKDERARCLMSIARRIALRRADDGQQRGRSDGAGSVMA